MEDYKIWVDVRGGYYVTIPADSLQEALDIAMDEADAFNVNEWDYDVEVCD